MYIKDIEHLIEAAIVQGEQNAFQIHDHTFNTREDGIQDVSESGWG